MVGLFQLFQISVLDNFLASGDEIGQGFTLQHSVAKECEIHYLVQYLVSGGEGLNVGTVGLAYGFTGFTGLGLFLLRGI